MYKPLPFLPSFSISTFSPSYNPVFPHFDSQIHFLNVCSYWPSLSNHTSSHCNMAPTSIIQQLLSKPLIFLWRLFSGQSLCFPSSFSPCIRMFLEILPFHLFFSHSTHCLWVILFTPMISSIFYKLMNPRASFPA